MEIYKIKLKEINPILSDSDATLTCYIHSQSEEYGFSFKRPAMFIIPGGGYQYVSERENEPVMAKYYAEGFNCFALNYSVNKKYPQPHLELAASIDYVNKHNDEYFNNGFKCGIGFSAGGHLLGSYSYLYPELASILNIDAKSIKPDFIILSYPVITMKESTHFGSKDVITNNEEELIEKLSIENHITSDYPPTFIWATETDACVPIINTKKMIKALEEAGVKHESFIYDKLGHGSSILTFDTRISFNPLTEDEINLKTWYDKSLMFFSQIFKK